MAKKRKPYNKSTGRDYKSDYAQFQSSDSAKKDRASRNAARRKMEKEGKVHKGDGRDVDHKNSKATDNSDSNLRVMSKSKNRGRTSKGKRV